VVCTIAMTPALLALYVMPPAPERKPATDAVQIIDPRLAFTITRAACFTVEKCADQIDVEDARPIFRREFIHDRQTAAHTRVGVADVQTAVLLDRCFDLQRRRPVSLDTSLTSASARPPALRMVSAVASTLSARSTHTTLAPCAQIRWQWRDRYRSPRR